LHRLLNIQPNDNLFFSGESVFFENVTADYLIIDEASMLDIFMLDNVLSATTSATKIIFVGDSNQLPSVSHGNVLFDIINSGAISVTKLDFVYRQGKGSMINLGAQAVISGNMPEFSKDVCGDLFFAECNCYNDFIRNITELLSFKLKKFDDGIDVKNDVQIIVPTKKERLGTVSLNEVVQDIVNSENWDNCVRVGKNEFKLGDKVMQIENNYEK